MDNPLEWDSIQSADFDPVDQVQPFLPELRKLSDARVSLSQDFTYIREDMERVKERQARKTALLNEVERMNELQEARERDEARKAERKSRSPNGHVVYKITLKDLNSPGLPDPLRPAPTGATNELEADAAATGLAADNNASEEDEDPPVDPTLDEAQQILLDFINGIARTKVVTAGTREG